MMKETLLQWDSTLLLALNGSESAFLDSLMWNVTHTITWVLFFLALFLLLLYRRTPRQFVLLVLLVPLIILVADQTASGLCKPLFQRLRPTHDPVIGPLVDVVNGYRGGRYGFFSSHASNTFAVFSFFSFLFKNRVVTLSTLFWAIVCSYSRIYLGVHYPTDILVGMVYGVSVGYLFAQFYHYATRNFTFFQQGSPMLARYSFSHMSLLLPLALFITTLYLIIKALYDAPYL